MRCSWSADYFRLPRLLLLLSTLWTKDKFEEEDKELEKQRTQRAQINQQRRAERQAQNDKIRKKYGLKSTSCLTCSFGTL